MPIFLKRLAVVFIGLFLLYLTLGTSCIPLTPNSIVVIVASIIFSALICVSLSAEEKFVLKIPGLIGVIAVMIIMVGAIVTLNFMVLPCLWGGETIGAFLGCGIAPQYWRNY